MTRVLVLGDTGYIGRHLVSHLRKEDFEVVAPGRVDLCSKRDVDNLDFEVETVFMMAGRTGPSKSWQEYEDFLSSNVLAVFHVVDALLKREEPPLLVFPSSRLVYRGSETPLVEDDPKDPKTPYALTKLTAEDYLRISSSQRGLNFLTFRIGVLYGPSPPNSQAPHGILWHMLRQVRSGLPITLYGDGSLRRTFTHVEDLCRVMTWASKMPECWNQVYNVGGEDLSLRDAALQFSTDLESVSWPKEALLQESGHTVFNSQRLDHFLGHLRRHSFADWARSELNPLQH